MKHFPIYIILITLFMVISMLPVGVAGSVQKEMNLLPIPAEIIPQEGTFHIDASFTISLESGATDRLRKAASRTLVRLSNRTGLFFKAGHFPVPTIQGRGLTLSCLRPGEVKLGVDESYTLTVAPGGVTLEAATDIGVIRGLETLLQLLDANERGYFFPALVIKDRPRFPWRGLLIDSCRHFMPVEVITRNLDAMAAVKMNVLHWHLTEDQGFRVESKRFPRLHQLGSDGHYYTQTQIKEIVAYAADRGIRVVPEFDIPGHSTSWLVGYPELASAPGPYQIERNWGVMDPTFDPTGKGTYKFFKKFFGEMATLFPDEYIHIGGDENNGKQWLANPRIQAFMKKNGIADNHALQAYFNRKILAILGKHGKKMVGWDEIFQPHLPNSIVIQSWRGQKALADAAGKGFNAILSNGYYIDLCQPTDAHYLNDPIPPDSPLSPGEMKYILGGEATMWAELISPETVDSRIWPRTAAIAERLWSPGNVRDVLDMYRRLERISQQLEEHGLLHIKNRGMMMRRLTRGMDTAPLQTLLDTIAPLKGYSRHHQGKVYNQFSPVTRVVDAAQPDAREARIFRLLVDRFLALQNEETAGPVISMLTNWSRNHARLSPIIAHSPILKEIETLSSDLSTVANIGIEALEFISSKEKIPAERLNEMRDILKKARMPRGETELMILEAIEKLTEAAR